jgi:hypothetical protein
MSDPITPEAAREALGFLSEFAVDGGGGSPWHTVAAFIDQHAHPVTSERPEVVTLCGSTRFRDAFGAENRRLTLEGRIVISVGLFGHLEGLDIGTDDEPSAVKVMLDALHFRKIDLSDRIHVINVGGYIGRSTANEIAYAQRTGKRVTYMEEVCDAVLCRGRGTDEDCAECKTFAESKRKPVTSEAVSEALDAIESLIHDEYDGTHVLDGYLAHLATLRAALAQQDGMVMVPRAVLERDAREFECDPYGEYPAHLLRTYAPHLKPSEEESA